MVNPSHSLSTKYTYIILNVCVNIYVENVEYMISDEKLTVFLGRDELHLCHWI